MSLLPATRTLTAYSLVIHNCLCQRFGYLVEGDRHIAHSWHPHWHFKGTLTVKEGVIHEPVTAFPHKVSRHVILEIS